MGYVFIKRTRGLQKIEQVKAHAKYVGFRAQESKEKGFFGRESDKVDYKDFVKRVENNPALQHSSSIKAQKLIFSLKENDYVAYLRSGKDYKDLVRNTLHEYEVKHNVKLDWIANIHDTEGHPHVHVIIKGVADEKDKDGRYKRIYFKKDDFKDMKANFDREFEKDAKYHLFEKIDINKTMLDISKGFENVTRNISNDIEKEQAKADFEKHKDIEAKIKKIERVKEKEGNERER